MNIEPQGKWEWKYLFVPLKPTGLPDTETMDKLLTLLEDGWYPDCATSLLAGVSYLLVREKEVDEVWK